MITKRPSNDRGHADHGWLNSRFTFSFADYYDPRNMGYKSLRVINEDYIKGGKGFGTHPHRDMEIITYILEGALQHKDSMGNGSVIKPGDVQRMSAGTGVAHSEFNPSETETCHLLQIWIMPDKRNYAPSYEQKFFSPEDRTNVLRLLASNDGRDGSVTIHQDASLYASFLEQNRSLDHSFGSGRCGFLQVTKGKIDVNGTELVAGDGIEIEEEPRIKITGRSEEKSEFVFFDLN